MLQPKSPATSIYADDVCRRRRVGNQPWLFNIGLSAGKITAVACQSKP